jgi:hypothetical protein
LMHRCDMAVLPCPLLAAYTASAAPSRS